MSKQSKPVKTPKSKAAPKPLYKQRLKSPSPADDLHATPLPESNFTLRDDGTISVSGPQPSTLNSQPSVAPELIFSDASHGIYLYHGNCLQLLDAIAAKYPDGRFDMIFADPPYFLSNGGITCHAGKMVKVDKGDWDKSQGPEVNHEFNREWLKRCQRVLKPNGTIWVSGTHHVIFSIGYAMQQLGFKILNDITWEKPNPPPNLSCRYFTHSTETIIWAARDEKSKHRFNYAQMRAANAGKQMKTVWTMTAPRTEEKVLGKHPTQKPISLLERIIIASTNEGESVFDPFLGAGTTGVACVRLGREFVGIELDLQHAALACERADREIIELVLRSLRVRIEISVFSENDLDLFSETIHGSLQMSDKPAIQAEQIYHETKFVFLSCARVSEASVVHTTVDVSLQEAWAKTPHGKRRESTHVVRCDTHIFKLKSTPSES